MQEIQIVCPFVDSAEACCAARLTFKHMAWAFARCAGHYRSCPTFHQLLRDSTVHDATRTQPDPVRLLAAS